MTTDLYAELGIDRAAKPEVVHAAYRRRAKKAHPDAGGNQEAFGRLQIAHAVLSDPERRAKYDETGQFEDGPADNADAGALEVIGQMLNARLEGEDEPTDHDLRDDLLRELRHACAAADKGLAKCAKTARRAERLAGRFKTRDGQATPIETLLRHQIRQAEQIKAKHLRAKAAFERALEMLEGWTFEADETLYPSAYQTALNRFAATRTYRMRQF